MTNFRGGNSCNCSARAAVWSYVIASYLGSNRILKIFNSKWSYNKMLIDWVKALVNEDTLLRTHCCPWCFLGWANLETFVADTKCFWTKWETFFVSRTQNLCLQQMLRERAHGETFVSATMCPQQCVLVWQGLNSGILNTIAGQLTTKDCGKSMWKVTS